MGSEDPSACVSVAPAKAAVAGPATATTTPAPPAAASGVRHLSPSAEAALRLLPGNDRCVECKAIYPQWAGVSFGILLCLACAGRHRSLGVQVSFVKSLGMDAWSPVEQRALEAGGNAKWIAICAGTSTTELSLSQKYTSGVAIAYKHRILQAATASHPISVKALTATAFLDMLARASLQSVPGAVQHHVPVERKNCSVPSSAQETETESETDTENPVTPSESEDDLRVKCTTCQSSIPLDQLDSHSTACVVSSKAVAWRRYAVTLDAPSEPLGISLTKAKGGFAEITRVVPGGLAERFDVVVGSFIIGLGNVRTTVFDEIVKMLKAEPRPVFFHFAVRSSESPARAMPTISSVPEPVSIEWEVVFSEPELGCAFQISSFKCTVASVSGGTAKENGVLVGSHVVEVNGRRVLDLEETLGQLQTTKRPLRLKFHRVEGLMRGWTKSTSCPASLGN